MAQTDAEGVPKGRLRTMQLLVGAFLMGVVIFMALALYLRHAGLMGPLPEDLLFTWLALGAGALLLAAYFLLPDRLVAGQLQKIALGSWRPPQPLPPDQPLTDVFALTVVYQSRLLVTLALLDGAAFLCLIAYLLEGELLCLVGAAIGVALMALRYPTQNGLEQWLEQQQRWLAEERTR